LRTARALRKDAPTRAIRHLSLYFPRFDAGLDILDAGTFRGPRQMAGKKLATAFYEGKQRGRIAFVQQAERNSLAAQFFVGNFVQEVFHTEQN
jgi:hypothetical protein